MEIDRRALKRRAREAMALPRPPFWAVALLYILLTSGVNLAVHFVTLLTAAPDSSFSQTGFFLSVLTLLYRFVIGFGLQLWCLWTVRRLSPGAGALIQGCSVWGRVLWMNVLIALRVYLLCFFALMGLMLAAELIFPPLAYLVYTTPVAAANLLAPVVTLLIWVLMLRYALAPYLLADRPEDGASAAVRRSAEMMRGFKWELAKLDLSFLGWEAVNLLLSYAVQGFFLIQGGLLPLLQAADWENALLLAASVSGSAAVYAVTALVTLPISLWLLPYRGVSLAGFYQAREDLARQDAPPLF